MTDKSDQPGTPNLPDERNPFSADVCAQAMYFETLNNFFGNIKRFNR